MQPRLTVAEKAEHLVFLTHLACANPGGPPKLTWNGLGGGGAVVRRVHMEVCCAIKFARMARQRRSKSCRWKSILRARRT